MDEDDDKRPDTRPDTRPDGQQGEGRHGRGRGVDGRGEATGAVERDATALDEAMALDSPDLDALLAAAAARVVEGIEPAAFVDWFVAESPRLAPVFAGTLSRAPEGDLRAGFARGLWNRFPQPDNRFRPRPLPAPGRNEPCVCGSGRKYKQCCRAREPDHAAMAALPLLLHVLERYPAEALDALDTAPMDPDDLLLVLDTWADEGEGERAVRLALSLFTSHRRLPRHAPEVLEILLEVWPQGFREEALVALVEELAGSRDVDIALIAAEERVRLRHDDDPEAAWTLFARELERFGEDPSLAALEVDLLVGEGRGDEAVAAAERWRSRLLAPGPAGGPARDTDLDPALIEFADGLLARASWIDPELALERACDEDDVLDRLVTLLDETPPGPIAGTHAPSAPSTEAASGRALVLAPTPAMGHAERDWHERFAGFDGLTEIVAYLDDAPLALSSFAVIESLAASTDAWAEESWAEAVLVRLLERAEMLLYRHVSRELGFETPEGLPDWDAMVWETAPEVSARHPENRAALGLLAGLAGWYRDLADAGGGGERRAATLGRALDGLDPRGG